MKANLLTIELCHYQCGHPERPSTLSLLSDPTLNLLACVSYQLFLQNISRVWAHLTLGHDSFSLVVLGVKFYVVQDSM